MFRVSPIFLCVPVVVVVHSISVLYGILCVTWSIFHKSFTSSATEGIRVSFQFWGLRRGAAPNMLSGDFYK